MTLLDDLVALAENRRFNGVLTARRAVGFVEEWRNAGAAGEPAVENGWAARTGARPPGFRLDSDGWVHLRGSLTHAAFNAASKERALLLPPTHCPAYAHRFPVLYETPTTDFRAELKLLPDGSVKVGYVAGRAVCNACWLEGIRFRIS